MGVKVSGNIFRAQLFRQDGYKYRQKKLIKKQKQANK